MSPFQPRDLDFDARVRVSFERQAVMHEIGATLDRVAPGEVDIGLPFRPGLAQQHGFFHAGIVATVLDSACGYAAFSLMPAGAGVLSVEFKINLLAPAEGESLRAVGSVIRPGRTIFACRGEAFVMNEGRVTQVAAMQATMMSVTDRPAIRN